MRLLTLAVVVLVGVVGIAFTHKRLTVLVLLAGTFVWSLMSR